MMNRIKNFVLGAVMAIGVMAASLTAMAGTQYVQTDMNFRVNLGLEYNKDSVFEENKEIELLLYALGINPDKYDPNKLRYGKIAICVDADK